MIIQAVLIFTLRVVYAEPMSLFVGLRMYTTCTLAYISKSGLGGVHTCISKDGFGEV